MEKVYLDVLLDTIRTYGLICGLMRFAAYMQELVNKGIITNSERLEVLSDAKYFIEASASCLM